jgi:hypothetical protein
VRAEKFAKALIITSGMGRDKLVLVRETKAWVENQNAVIDDHYDPFDLPIPALADPIQVERKREDIENNSD